MNLLFNTIFILIILALIVINLRTLLLPNSIIFPGLIFAFLTRIILVIFGSNEFGSKIPIFLSSTPLTATILDSLIGAFIGLGTLWIVNSIWYQIRKIEILGYGDMKMLAMVGAYLGIFNTIGVLFLGIVLIFICFSLLRLLEDKFSFLPTGFIWGIPAILFTLISVNKIIGLIIR
jgi:leader peptidase (prepilin peptidase) / N-methyltransferase